MRLFTLLKLEIRQSLRRYNDFTAPLWFLILITCVFAISFQQNPTLLQQAAPAILWTAVLLALLLSINQLFSQDYASGTLEQMLLSPLPLTQIIWVKITAYWLKTCLPILAFIPVMAVLLHLPFAQLNLLIGSLLLGTPTLTLLSAFNAALTLRLSQNALLLVLLTLPLCLPVLIFGLSLGVYAQWGLDTTPLFCFLIALLVLSAGLLPFIIAFSLRLGMNGE